ncbi:hypothetical protein F5B20DRAFT_312894 [Whalleya microplaca]|nr:hypothetical protein F5B20DRAFT_312894 [Whalleya microplaca]
MEVATLVQQMQGTLSEINDTVKALSTRNLDARLDELEEMQENLLTNLHSKFNKEMKDLESKRVAEIEDIREKRRKEDEEREARRRREDEELRKRKAKENEERQRKLDEEENFVRDETEHQMDEVEDETQKKFDSGKQKLHDLEEKRREINRQIDEKLSMPLPTEAVRKRSRAERGSSISSNTAGNKPPSKKTEKPPDKSNANAAGNETLAAEITPLAPSEIGDKKPAEQSSGGSRQTAEKRPKKQEQPSSKDPANSTTGKSVSNGAPKQNPKSGIPPSGHSRASSRNTSSRNTNSPQRAKRDTGGKAGT